MSTNNPIPIREHEPRVRATTTEIVFDGFVERDPDVVQALGEADDIEHAAHAVMQIGARAVRLASTTTDANVVEKAFDQLTATFEEKLVTNLKQVTDVNDQLFNDGGQVGQILKAFAEGLDTTLDETFDPDSKKSVIAKVEKVTADMAKAQQDAMRRLVDPSEDDSPLRKIQRDLAEVIKSTSGELTKQLNELSERLAVDEKAAEVFKLTTLKGATFEEAVHATLSGLAATHGDTAEACGTETGFAGNKKGDEVITLNSEDTGGSTCRVTFEMKDRKLGMAAVTSELDAAMENRGAAAAVLVFAEQSQAPTAVSFCYSGSHAIVVFDKDDPDVNAVRLAYMWARWVARRSQVSEAVDELDREKVTGLFDRIGAALEKAKMVRRGHTQSVKGLQFAGTHLDSLERDACDALDELRSALDS